MSGWDMQDTLSEGKHNKACSTETNLSFAARAIYLVCGGEGYIAPIKSPPS